MNRSVNQYYRQQKLRKMQAAGLAVVFLLVLWFQFGRTTNDAEIVTAASAPPTSVAATIEPERETPKPDDDAIELPQLSIEQIIAANPFSTPQTATIIEPEPQPKIIEAPSEPIAPPAVAAIYKTPTGWAALVDRQVVRPGDYLSTGHRVLDVTPTGIRVELAN